MSLNGDAGHYGRFALFPERERGDELYHNNQYIAHRMLLSALCYLAGTSGLSPFFAHQHGTAVGLSACFVGMIIVVLNGRFVLHLSPVGDALAFTACMSWAVYSLLMKSVSGDYGAAFITRKVFFYGVLTILPYYLIIPGWPAWDVFMKPQVVGNLLFLGCLASMICFLTWNWCISKLGAVKATNWVYFNPITTMISPLWYWTKR